jgi:hypothetical protein
MKTNTSIGRCPSRAQKAFSIIEATIGMAVVGIALVSLFAAMSATWNLMQVAREDLRATQIMVDKLETIRLYSWLQINGTNSNGSNTFLIPKTFTAYYYPIGTNTNGLAYTGQLIITNPPITASYSNNMKLVTVRLSWKSGKTTRAREMSSLVSKDGLQRYIY